MKQKVEFVWVADSPLLEMARFHHQGNLTAIADKPAKLLVNLWRAAIWISERKKDGSDLSPGEALPPEYSDVSLYHFRTNRFLDEDQELSSQEIQNGDLLVILRGDSEAKGILTAMIAQTPGIPQRITGVPKAPKPITYTELVESMGGREPAKSPPSSLGQRAKRRTARPTSLGKETILFLAADPSDACRLRLGQEYREIQNKLRLCKQAGRFELKSPQLSARPEDISQALLDALPRIVHISGHGTPTGALCFENQLGQSQLVPPDALAALFELFSDEVDCVVLNACFSKRQAMAIGAHIENVIGMDQAISDDAAIAFAIGFYQALGAGRTIDEAYKFGCVQIGLHNIPEHLTPVFIHKGAVQ
jgi:hypothetical protein